MKYRHYILKRKVEDVFIWPFVLIGRVIASLFPLQKDYDVFFFFPFYHTGGAEKVHALIAQATGGKQCIIYFTRKSVDKNFYDDFVRSGCTIKDISRYTDSKVLYFLNVIYRGIVTGYINRQKQHPIVFNGQCNFGYKISPWVKSSIPQIELSHSFNTFSWIRIPFIPFYRKTVMISKLRIEQHLQQYRDFKVPAEYGLRITYIVNGIPLPADVRHKEYSGTINVLYVGRGTEEKRVHLVAAIAKECAVQGLPVMFQFMGDVEQAISNVLRPYCTFLGHKSNAEEIDSIYQQAHVVIITSSTEGFPMVIEEGMARGCAVIATPVGDIPLHVRHGRNGLLFSSVESEESIISEGVQYLSTLSINRNELEAMGVVNRIYANNTFSIEAFNNAYKKLFQTIKNDHP